jgi:DNA polymerase-3 subunit epsilon
MQNFTAIDFETAQGKCWSICQIGLVRVEDSKIVDRVDLLVCPSVANRFSKKKCRYLE